MKQMIKNFQLKIVLKGISPPIWRRILVSSDMTFLELHDMIQFVFGWMDYHLFIFECGSFSFVNYLDWEEDADKFQSAEESVLGDVIPKYFPKGSKFLYRYDIGDGWEHEILVEEISGDSNVKTPVCLDGSRACPPEDVGGTWGYQHLLEVLQDPSDEEYESYLSWVGGQYDPEDFNLVQVNKNLRSYLRTRKLSRNSYWRSEDRYFSPVPFESKWTREISSKHAEVAKSLPIRRDLVTLLNYLKTNRVKGTNATGNFPRKDIRAITAMFVNPPELDLKLGDRVFEMRSEDEVPELMFVHILANTAGLIYGGESLQWTLTELGEDFLRRDPIFQTWYLTAYWFDHINWYYLYPYDDFDSVLDLRKFEALIYDVFLNIPLSEKVTVQYLIDKINEKSPLWITYSGARDDFHEKFYFLYKVLLKPFDRFGIINLFEPEGYIKSIYDASHFYFSDYGMSLIRYFSDPKKY